VRNLTRVELPVDGNDHVRDVADLPGFHRLPVHLVNLPEERFAPIGRRSSSDIVVMSS